MPRPSWLLRLFPWLHRQRAERELDDEVRLHLELETRRHLDAGMRPTDAARAARVKLGNCPLIKEDTRAVWSWRWLEDFARDMRLALRTLRRDATFTAAVVGTLAVALAACAVVISIITGLLQINRVDEPERLVLLRSQDTRRPNTRVLTSALDFLDWRDQTTSFSAMAAYRFGNRNLTGVAEPQRLSILEVTPNVLDMFGIRPLQGRGFSAADAGDRVVIASHRFWMQVLAARTDPVGHPLSLDGVTYTVIGILPPDLLAGDLVRADLWLPLDERAARTRARDQRELAVWGRLRPHVTMDETRADLGIVAQRLEHQYPDTNTGWGASVTPFAEALLPPQARMVLGLLAVLAGFVTLVACGNVATLWTARATACTREIGIRLALGAKRSQLVRQAMTEAAVISVAAGLVGAFAAFVGLRAAVAAIRTTNPFVSELGFDRGALLLTVAVAMMTPLLFAFVPALAAVRIAPEDAVRARASGGATGVRRRVLFVASEVALALVLVVLAGLMVRTGLAVWQIPLGFEPEGVLTMRVELPRDKYADQGSQAAFADRVLMAVERIPGVRAAAVAPQVMIADREQTAAVEIEGRRDPANANLPWAVPLAVTAAYTDVLGVPLVAGRSFDAARAELDVALIDLSMARRYWPNGQAIGARLRFAAQGPDSPSWLTIVGIVGDVRSSDADQPALPHVYVPYARSPGRSLALLLRVDGDPVSMARSAREAVWSVDPDQPVHDVRSLAQVVFDDLAEGVIWIGLLVALALIAVLLAGTGVYAILSFLVSMQVRDIAIRVALGSTRNGVLAMVLRQVLTYAITGITVGLAGAWTVGRLLADQFYGVSPSDPVTLGSGILLVLVVVISASWLPAWRATKVDPMVALRSE